VAQDHRPRLLDRVAIVTGAGRGLGREIGRAYAREGARLALGSRSELELAAVASDLEAIGCEVVTRVIDVRVAADIATLASAALARWGRIDVLVNNAGITHGAAGRKIETILDVDTDFWELTFATNCRGPFLASRAVIPTMIEQGRGSIINISSSLAGRALAANIPYGPSKAALASMTGCLAAEFGHRGVRANLLHPGGPVNTGIFTDFYRPFPGVPLLDPEVIGPAAVWLASDDSQDVNGETIDARLWLDERGHQSSDDK
jgi:3-oxoacyl-[acyl-carrier protein] reductase